MNQDVANSFIKKHLPLMLVIGAWISISLLYITLKQYRETIIYAGFLVLVGQVVPNLIITSLAFLLWKKTTGQVKIVFTLFSISFLLLTISDVNYNIAVNILGVINSLLTARIPFIGFLIFQLLGWSIVFLKSKTTQNGRTFLISYLPITIIISIIFTVFFLANLTWKVQSSSFFKLCCLVEAILQVIGFIFALLCLSIAANKQIRFIVTGFLLIIASDFFAEVSHLTQSLLPLSGVAITWILGLLLITFGFYGMLKNPSNLKMDKWLNNLNSVQAQCAFWSFLLCMVLLIAFCGILIGYNLLKVLPLQYLPSVLIGFSVFAVLISSILARILSSPFNRVMLVIDSYMNGKDVDMTQEKSSSSVYEFEVLENFLTRSFETLKEKNKAQRELFNCATQVAHDIRSPATSLSMMSN